MAFPPLGNSDHVVVSVLVLIGTIFMIIWEMFRERLSLNLVLLLLLVNFVRVQVGIDVYIPQRKFQVKPPWF